MIIRYCVHLNIVGIEANVMKILVLVIIIVTGNVT